MSNITISSGTRFLVNDANIKINGVNIAEWLDDNNELSDTIIANVINNNAVPNTSTAKLRFNTANRKHNGFNMFYFKKVAIPCESVNCEKYSNHKDRLYRKNLQAIDLYRERVVNSNS
tara:strand:+ start:132 stop:485 length:354 start_codon:yes stop_codon:yes gene_type:complete